MWRGLTQADTRPGSGLNHDMAQAHKYCGGPRTRHEMWFVSNKISSAITVMTYLRPHRLPERRLDWFMLSSHITVSLILSHHHTSHITVSLTHVSGMRMSEALQGISQSPHLHAKKRPVRAQRNPPSLREVSLSDKVCKITWDSRESYKLLVDECSREALISGLLVHPWPRHVFIARYSALMCVIVQGSSMWSSKINKYTRTIAQTFIKESSLWQTQ